MSRTRRRLLKATPFTRIEQLELKLMPETIYVEVEGAQEDVLDDDKAMEDAYTNLHLTVEDCYDGGIISEYRLVRQFRKRTETLTHCDPV